MSPASAAIQALPDDVSGLKLYLDALAERARGFHHCKSSVVAAGGVIALA